MVGVFSDAAVIIAVSILSGAIYHEAAYGAAGSLLNFVKVGSVAAGTFVLPSIIRGDYAPSNYLSFRSHIRHVSTLWNVMILFLLAFGFLIKVTDIYSRGSIILFYAGGLPALLLMRYALVRAVIVGSKIGFVSTQRVFLIGTERDIAVFMRRYRPWDFGLQTVGTAHLGALSTGGGPTARHRTVAADLAEAVDAVRLLRPDAVFIIAPWSEQAAIEQCIEAFLTIPVEIHLGPEHILDRFANVRIFKLGPMSSLQVTRPPLTWFELLQKRMFDVAIAASTLVLLSPLLLAMAFLIRWESAGPVFFLQRRYGFNQQLFKIIKFRTMTTLEDGDIVRQATLDDRRCTRIGRWLRRWNIDELPQLINVLKGDMSLVGPRPHALSHNRHYERKIALYARRHNVLPGITGWAQVNGFRGETDTDEKMQRRVDHDLFYIDNWSLLFDLRILLMTVFSHKAYRNAS